MLFNWWQAEGRLVARKRIWELQILHDIILRLLIALLKCLFLNEKKKHL